jgi:hypothetical protein
MILNANCVLYSKHAAFFFLPDIAQISANNALPFAVRCMFSDIVKQHSGKKNPLSVLYS